MIARTAADPQTAQRPVPGAWRRSLAQAVTDPAELLALLDLPSASAGGLLDGMRRAGRLFPLRVPRGFVARMRKGDLRDPLLAQILPVAAELQAMPGFTADPLGELASAAVPGVLHKYQGRVLLVAAGACAVHCRYCFRREFPYAEQGASAAGFEQALAYLAADPTIDEVILSGGDPLLLPDARLARLAEALAEIPHLTRLRVHTRTPIVLPERVDDDLLAWLTGTRLAPVVVLHANHAREIDAEVAAAMARFKEAGVPLLNQAVLLRGVNDSVEALADLSRALFAAGALPYYLHLLDRVRGTAHFEVEEQEAVRLMAALTALLPGYLVPRLVREVAGAPGKTPVRVELD